MTFPKRWLEDDDSTGVPSSRAMRDVLRAGRDMDPPAGSERAVWLALAAQIGAGAGATGAAGAAGASAKAAGGAAAGNAAATGAGVSAGAATGTGATLAGGAASGGLLKAILIGAFSGIVAITGYSAIEPASAPPSPAPSTSPEASAAAQAPASPGNGKATKQADPAIAPAPGADPSAAPSSKPASAEPQPHATAAAPQDAPANNEPSGAAAAPSEPVATSTFAPGSPEERASRLREESELLNQARASVRAGNGGEAIRLLEQARQKFPDGVLGQEREALTIEALAKSGAREAASARAAAFIKAHPTSPHAARLQTFVQP